MKTGYMLLMLAVWFFSACADTNMYSRNAMIDRASTCATCGGAISDNYFAGSAFKAIGPGSY
jgi:hypothetical protein